MKSVVYLTCTKLPCIGTSQAPVILCLKDTIELVSSTNHIAASLVTSTEIFDDCSGCVAYWRYTLGYDETLLVDPETLLVPDDIVGIFCKTCFTDWIESFGVGLPVTSFSQIDVPEGTNPVADAPSDTLTFAAGANIQITGDAGSDTVTFEVTDVATESFKTIDVPAGTDPVAGAINSVLTLEGDANLSITGNAVTDSIAFANTFSANNTFLVTRNFADDANLDLLKADASDNSVINFALNKKALITHNGATVWEVRSDGDLVSDVTNGGHLRFNKAGKTVVNAISTAVTAAGTVFADSTVLTTVEARVTAGGANAGVRLPDIPVGASGKWKNETGNNIKAYPVLVGDFINFTNSVTIPTGSTMVYTRIATTVFNAYVAPSP